MIRALITGSLYGPPQARTRSDAPGITQQQASKWAKKLQKLEVSRFQTGEAKELLGAAPGGAGGRSA